MGRPVGERRRYWDGSKRRYLAEVGARIGIPLELEGQLSSRWARTPSGPIAVLASDELRGGDWWWFSLHEGEFRERRARGVVLLCESKQDLFDFGVPASRVAQFLPHLSPDHKGERKLNVFRRSGRYWLQVPGRDDVDLTDARGDLTWLRPDSAGENAVEAGTRPEASPRAEAAAGFFARVRNGRLEPLDETGLAEGDLVLVNATVALAVPATAALRRIVARGGPVTLPADFAEQHDYYGRGAARR